MANTRVLGRRLSCLMAGLFDGSPISNFLTEAGFDVTHSAVAPDTLDTLEGETFEVIFAADSLGRPALQAIITHAAHAARPTPVVVVATASSPTDGGPQIGAVPATGTGADVLTIPVKATLAEVERIVIAEHLRRSRTKAEAARSLGMGLRTLYTKIGKLQLADVSHGRLGRRDEQG